MVDKKILRNTILMVAVFFYTFTLGGCVREEQYEGNINNPYIVEVSNPRHSGDVGDIHWLELANDEDYPITKEWIRQFILENTGLTPQKVAISFDEAFINPTCYFKQGDWYEFSLEESRDINTLRELFILDTNPEFFNETLVWIEGTENAPRTIKWCEALSAEIHKNDPALEKFFLEYFQAEFVAYYVDTRSGLTELYCNNGKSDNWYLVAKGVYQRESDFLGTLES